jgi:CheY-like chemotaxis protein
VPPSRPLVLVVEDDDSTRSLLATALQPRFEVFAAADGLEALQLLATIPTPDALVLDVMMPRLDGLQLGRQLKADPKLRHVPIVYLTARSGALDVVAGINAGGRHYLVKPFKMTVLMGYLERMVAPPS